MSFSLPKRSKVEAHNVIRDVFERGAGIPGFISFGIGNPASETIPVKKIQEEFCRLIIDHPLALLQYGPMNGDNHLAEQTIKHLVTKRNMSAEGQSILISSGSGQCLGLVPRTVCEDGDEVYMDAYTFTSGINAVRNCGAAAIGVAMDDDGMIPEALEEAAKSGKGKYIYLIPNFQNPTGITMPLERRKAIYEIACKYDLLIYEDDPYGEIQFTEMEEPTFKSFDVEDRVLYAGSYSKTMAAGLRVGFLFGPTSIIESIQMLKNNQDGQMPLITQQVVSAILDDIDFDKQLITLGKVYKEKCDLMVNTLKEYGSKNIKIVEPKGGMFTWITLPEHVDADAFFEACMAQKVGIIPSAAFAADGVANGHSFRLNYTVPTKEQIVTGAKIVAELSKKFCD